MSSLEKKGFNIRWARFWFQCRTASWRNLSFRIFLNYRNNFVYFVVFHTTSLGWWLSIPTFCSGEHPRNFSIHPSGNWLLVANQDTWLCRWVWRATCTTVPSLLFLSITCLLLVWMNGWMGWMGWMVDSWNFFSFLIWGQQQCGGLFPESPLGKAGRFGQESKHEDSQAGLTDRP